MSWVWPQLQKSGPAKTGPAGPLATVLDLPHIEVPVTRKHAKRKVTGTSAVDGPPSKKICISPPKKSTSPSPETPIIVSEVQSSFIFHCVEQHESVAF